MINNLLLLVVFKYTVQRRILIKKTLLFEMYGLYYTLL